LYHRIIGLKYCLYYLYFVLRALVRPSTTGFTRPIYSQKLVAPLGSRYRRRDRDPTSRRTLLAVRCRRPHHERNTASTPRTDENGRDRALVLRRTPREPWRRRRPENCAAVLVGTQDARRLANAVVLVDGATPPKDGCRRHGFDLRDDRHGNRIGVGNIFQRIWS